MTRPQLQDLEAEQAVIGYGLRGKKAALRIVTEYAESDFTLELHRQVRLALGELLALDRPIDPVSVWMQISGETRGDRERKWFDYLQEIDGLPTAPSALDYYGGKVKRYALRRQLRDVRDRLTERIYNLETDADQIPGLMTLELLQLKGQAASGPQRLSDYGRTELTRIRAGKAREALLTGLSGVDQLTGGLERGETGLIVGRPGKGKTVALVQLAQRAAESWGPVALISLEMGGESLWDRLLASITSFSYREIRDAGRWLGSQHQPFSAEELAELEVATNYLSAAAEQIHLATCVHELDRLIFTTQRLRLEHGIEAVFIDYGGLIVDGRPGKRGRAEEMTAIAVAVKQQIAVQLNIPVWVGIQASADVEKEGTKSRGAQAEDGARVDRPIGMADVSWAQQWIRDASLMIALNPDPSFAPRDTPQQRAMFWSIPKARNAPGNAQVPMYLRASEFRFTERYEEAPEGNGRAGK